MVDPKTISPGSIMPAYTWLNEQPLNTELTVKKLKAMKTMGVPYTPQQIRNARRDLRKQAHEIAIDIVNNMPDITFKTKPKQQMIREIEKREITALIAYLQRLGTDIKAKPKQ